MILALLGLLALSALLLLLVRTIASDGYGTLPTPRSHAEELGSWVNQQLAHAATPDDEQRYGGSGVTRPSLDRSLRSLT